MTSYSFRVLEQKGGKTITVSRNRATVSHRVIIEMYYRNVFIINVFIINGGVIAMAVRWL